MPTASLIFHYFGENSQFTRLAQDTVPLHLGFEGYDRKILLHHPSTAGPFKMNQEAIESADVVEAPTKENLVKHLNDLRVSGHATDLYIFSHGSPGNFRTSKGTYGDNGTITASYIEHSILSPLNLRAVWQVNCYGASMNPTWRKLGAKVVAGSRYVNFYPTRFTAFAKFWNGGVPFGTAVSQSDTAAIHTPVQAYMLADAASRLKEWEGNLLEAATILGNNDASRRYFKACWLEDAEHMSDPLLTNVSGKIVMNRSSLMHVDGNRALIKS